MRGIGRLAFGIGLSALSLGLLIRLIDWQKTVAALRAADPLFTALAVTCLLISLVAKTVRWRLLLPANAPLPTARLFRILHISFLLNNVFPARLGDVARVAMTARQPGVRLGHVLSSLMTERVSDTLTLLIGFVAVSPFLPLPAAYKEWLHIAWAVLAGAVFLVLVGTWRRHTLGRVLRGLPLPLASRVPGRATLRAEASSFAEGWRQLLSRRNGAAVMGWSWTAWLFAFAINWLLMRALGIEAPLAVAVLLTCTTNLAMLIPSSPGYLGVFHAAATLSLLPFGVGAGVAFSFAILAHLVNVLPVSLLGLAFVLYGRETIGLNLRRALRAPDAVPLTPSDP